MTGGPVIEQHRAWTRVQARLVALTADVLPDVTPLPAALRRVATFTPARRVRSGASAIRSALSGEDFRRAVATQVAALPTSDDPVERSARLWLERPEGWEDSLSELLDELHDTAGESARIAAELERSRGQLRALRVELDQAHGQRSEDEQKLRDQVLSLRRKVGEARAAQRAAESAIDAAHRERDEALGTLEAERSRADAATQLLREEIERLRAEGSTTRREARAEREAASTRAWYLLDALVESAVGLRRELGLPAPAGTPADPIEVGLAGTEVARSTRASSTGMVENLLSVPRARLIVDGYNVTKTVWPTATLEAQRSRLVAALAGLVARTGAETTVVFDAAATGSRPAVPAPRGVRVVFSPRGTIADDVIRQLVSVEPRGRTVVVVTNDREIVVDVERQGARTVVSEVFAELLKTG